MGIIAPLAPRKADEPGGPPGARAARRRSPANIDATPRGGELPDRSAADEELIGFPISEMETPRSRRTAAIGDDLRPEPPTDNRR